MLFASRVTLRCLWAQKAALAWVEGCGALGSIPGGAGVSPHPALVRTKQREIKGRLFLQRRSVQMN